MKPKLTKRQEQITRLVSLGFSAKVVADFLRIDNDTVWYHLILVYRLTKTDNLVSLTRWALRNGYSSL